MTTSAYSASAESLPRDAAARLTPHKNSATPSRGKSLASLDHSLASRFIMLILCVAIVFSTMAYGTVHSWSLALFETIAASLVVLWAVDAWRTGALRVSRNALQWPLAGLCLVGLVQLLPYGGASALDLPGATHSLSLDPYSTRMALVQIFSLLIYFGATLAFTDSSDRLRLLVRVITIFGFLLAVFGLIQSFVSPMKIYGLRDLSGVSIPFGPFINRHHFAGYMEMTLALPLGLLFSGSVKKEQRPLYIFAVAVMGIALILTNSRGGLLSLFALICFLVGVAGIRGRGRTRREQKTMEADERRRRARSAMARAGIGLALMIALLTGAVLLGGETVLSRFTGTIDASDPTNGRLHFWHVTLDVIRDHPVIGAGLGAFGLAYTQYDSSDGALLRVEQVHNDYLQVLSDAGIIGAVFGAFFIITLFRMGFARRESTDEFRRGVATGALAGCFAVLVHSFFDFTLHTTSNALLFLVMAALATLNGQVEQQQTREAHGGGRRRRRHRSSSKGRSDGSPQLNAQVDHRRDDTGIAQNNVASATLARQTGRG